VSLLLTERDGEAVIAVGDQGIGIPLADQARLFESFHRASNVGTRQGTGLGLVIVKKAVELHGGTISIESEVDAGTHISVRLPLPQMALAH
jgi:signal transduction histidine kinase